MTSILHRIRRSIPGRGLALLVGAGLAFAWAPIGAGADPGDNCSGSFYIDETLPSGGRWQMCWEHHGREGIVLRDVFFTPPGGSFRRIFYQAGVSQIHVPYDDNGARFHDVSDYGLGDGNMNDLTPADCPGGSLLKLSSKDVICKTIESRGDAHRHGHEHAEGHTMRLFSVSHVGEYNYIPQWSFFDDGTIDISMGATGELQRRDNPPVNPLHGWPIRDDGTLGISHVHNYYWRLDFDLGPVSGNDVVEEIDFNTVGATREMSINVLSVEEGRSAAPEKHRSWRVRSANIDNADGHPVSYHLVPGGHGHRHIGPSYEAFTFDDFYVTAYDGCEDFVSHNPTTGGCAGDVTGFVDGENTFDADIVVYYGITFHHVPRDEDEAKMVNHWDGFQVVPRDWTAEGVLPPPCSDGVDNDGDGFVDVGADPGCDSGNDLSERSATLACDDGFDNDGDGDFDFDDSYCTPEKPQREAPPKLCGLGFELVLVVPLLLIASGRRRAMLLSGSPQRS
jgi:primary-amine oxidase